VARIVDFDAKRWPWGAALTPRATRWRLDEVETVL